ncbi:PREDICTED: outer dense fiber protein 3-like [Ceratosolen solmsi marchali]|uniref:Outer dense fiber protein 3-like n=1 Tax=Ceratosolen solmsi marchali TaxID=326594 RepID=A0AAJ6YBB6_9HYME|nr:PREDICTED: outer dense fiber protein 3-like [Ceratosolen solmsi marchali]
MELEKKNKPNSLNCMKKGPGPQYMLKTLIGFDDHDPTKYRNPAYTMKFLLKNKVRSTGPGPYPITAHLTNHGLEMSPAYTIVFKPHEKFKDKVPGPGAYAPEKARPMNHHLRAAAYTMRFKHYKNPINLGPGPIYMLPTCIGPEIPDIRAEGAYTMSYRHKQFKPNIGPGPAAYSIITEKFKRKSPAYSIKLKHELSDLSRYLPGPKYNYNLDTIKKRQPKYSFGVRYSECTTVPLIEEDKN